MDFGPKLFWGLIQKTAIISICKKHIYIDLKVSDKLIEKCRSRDFGDGHFCQNGILTVEIWPFLGFLEGQTGKFGSNLLLLGFAPYY